MVTDRGYSGRPDPELILGEIANDCLHILAHLDKGMRGRLKVWWNTREGTAKPDFRRGSHAGS